jgi:acylphosphatase
VSDLNVAARRVVVHGRVQGVFFRDSTRRRAQAAGVTGWVRNNPDGTVEAWLEGAPEAVDDLTAWIRDGGPSRAEVRRVEAEPAEPQGHGSFKVRH